jgi:hypothetical protein
LQLPKPSSPTTWFRTSMCLCNNSCSPVQKLNAIYSQAVFSLGLLFLQIFLMKPVD